MEALGERPHHQFEHLPVASIRAAFCLGLKFAVEFEDGGVGQTLTMVCEHGTQDRQNSRLPINQSAVTVKADGGETREIHRRGEQFSVLSYQFSEKTQRQLDFH